MTGTNQQRCMRCRRPKPRSKLITTQLGLLCGHCFDRLSRGFRRAVTKETP